MDIWGIIGITGGVVGVGLCVALLVLIYRSQPNHRVLRYLRKHGPTGMSQLWAGSGVDAIDGEQAIWELRNSGRIKVTKKADGDPVVERGKRGYRP
jgi:hypothetical protein